MRFAVIVSVLLLSACSNQGMQDLESFVAETKAKPGGSIPPIPEIKEVESYLYVPALRRDPFTPENESGETEDDVTSFGIRPDPNRRKEELENYSLDSLAMVGTMEQEGSSWGLVKSKDGTIHRVQVGNYMGLQHGQIVAINEDRIQLIELVPSGTGYLEQEAAISIGEKQEN